MMCLTSCTALLASHLWNRLLVPCGDSFDLAFPRSRISSNSPQVRSSMASIMNKGFRVCREDLVLWIFRSSEMSHAPDSFESYWTTPVPKCVGLMTSPISALPGFFCRRITQ